METVCPKCDGMGMQIAVRSDGTQAAEPCECRHQLRVNRLLERARIPRRYEHCALENYSYQGRDQSLYLAHQKADKFLDGYPALTKESGLLFTGSIGIGKTHLAAGILKALIVEKGVKGLFCDYRELLKEIQNSYNPQVAATELEVLAPIFEAEVLVIDELGAAKPTDWVWDTVALIINTRYNDKRTTIITTNYADDAPAGGKLGKEETLGDRIGERMRSRLSEMCVMVEMRGEDFRRTAGRARFV